jgi:hypothetical protein
MVIAVVPCVLFFHRELSMETIFHDPWCVLVSCAAVIYTAHFFCPKIFKDKLQNIFHIRPWIKCVERGLWDIGLLQLSEHTITEVCDCVMASG